jgi:hypothetical protein
VSWVSHPVNTAGPGGCELLWVGEKEKDRRAGPGEKQKREWRKGRGLTWAVLARKKTKRRERGGRRRCFYALMLGALGSLVAPAEGPTIDIF